MRDGASATYDLGVRVLTHRRHTPRRLARGNRGLRGLARPMLRWRRMRSSALFASFAALTSAVYACSGLGDALTSESRGPEEGGDARSPAGPSDAVGELGPSDNGVILVHAAQGPSFRLCFRNEVDRLPQPDSKVMPEANVVGVEVGSAVRIGPLRGAPGEVFLFPEPLIRSLPSANRTTCQALLSHPTLSQLAVSLGTVDADLSRGVHLLVVTGCPAKSALHTYTKEQCGDSYEDEGGNLAVRTLALQGGARSTPDELPTQVVHLSQALEQSRAGRTIIVSFGDITSNSARHVSLAEGPELFGALRDLEAPPRFDPTEEAIYAERGFRVSLGADAGAPVVLAQQSLADVQRMSAPRDVPPTYYGAASNYVLLLLGDPEPRDPVDGGPVDDELRKLHFLAVPVIEAAPDAGVDAGGEDAGEDAGP